MNAVAALGSEFEIADPRGPRAAPPERGDLPRVPSTIRLAEYPQLKRLAWQLHGVARLAPNQALSLCERNWRHVDLNATDPRANSATVRALGREFGAGRLLVRT